MFVGGEWESREGAGEARTRFFILFTVGRMSSQMDLGMLAKVADGFGLVVDHQELPRGRRRLSGTYMMGKGGRGLGDKSFGARSALESALPTM